jgi:hypothetical protein
MRDGMLKGDKGLAAFFGVHPDTIRKSWRKKYKFPGIKIGKAIFYDPDEVRQMLKKVREIDLKNSQKKIPL